MHAIDTADEQGKKPPPPPTTDLNEYKEIKYARSIDDSIMGVLINSKSSPTPSVQEEIGAAGGRSGRVRQKQNRENIES